MGPIALSNVTESQLFHLQGSKYADPVFSWRHSIGVTEIEFFTSDKLGSKYKDNIFVGDYNAGQLYFFKVNKDRDGLQTTGNLADHIADSYDESLKARVGLFPGGVVDIKTGPDGYLYMLTFTGKVYRIEPA
jgi:glucose/arabinose dehydrogenase